MQINAAIAEAVGQIGPAVLMRYEVCVNGVLDHTIAGADRTILYVTNNGENTFTVIAVDSAGNWSTPATVTLFIPM